MYIGLELTWIYLCIVIANRVFCPYDECDTRISTISSVTAHFNGLRVHCNGRAQVNAKVMGEIGSRSSIVTADHTKKGYQISATQPGMSNIHAYIVRHNLKVASFDLEIFKEYYDFDGDSDFVFSAFERRYRPSMMYIEKL